MRRIEVPKKGEFHEKLKKKKKNRYKLNSAGDNTRENIWLGGTPSFPVYSPSLALSLDRYFVIILCRMSVGVFASAYIEGWPRRGTGGGGVERDDDSFAFFFLTFRQPFPTLERPPSSPRSGRSSYRFHHHHPPFHPPSLSNEICVGKYEQPRPVDLSLPRGCTVCPSSSLPIAQY